MSYGRIVFPTEVHHYGLGKDTYDNWYFNVSIHNNSGEYIREGDGFEMAQGTTKSQAIEMVKGMVEYHLSDDYPLQ
tara:strand:- start:3 stop:230 length:228 start_codon:yes stop_codon:yes gene_type:complete